MTFYWDPHILQVLGNIVDVHIYDRGTSVPDPNRYKQVQIQNEFLESRLVQCIRRIFPVYEFVIYKAIALCMTEI